MKMKPATYWIGGSILAIALVYGLWALRPLWVKDTIIVDASPSQPEETLSFADSSSIKIYEIQRGTISHTFPTTGSGGSFWSSGHGSSGGSSGDGHFTVSHKSSGAGLESLTFESETNALLVEFRFCEYADTSSLPWTVASERGELKSIDHTSSSYSSSEWTTDQMIKADPTAKTPDFLIQIRNSDGDWVTGNIATPCDADPWLRSVVGFEAWPSSETDLEFRVIRKGHQPQEFSLANPDVRSAKAWTSKPLPQTIDTANYSLSLESVTLQQTDLWGEVVEPKFSLESKIKGIPYPYNTYVNELETDRGETPGEFGYRKYPVDPSVEKIKLTVHARASRKYPYPREKAVIFAQCVVAEDGTIKKVDITNKVLGYTTINAGKPKENGYVTFELIGVWPSTSSELAASREVGGWDSKRHVVYIDDDPTTTGDTSGGGGSSSGSGRRTEFERNFTFQPDEPLEPGQTLSLGFVQPPPVEIHEFIVDRPDFSRKSDDG